MKNLLLISSLLLLIGCGGNGNSTLDTNITDSNLTDSNISTEIKTTMQIGTIYNVFTGDTISRETNESKIEISYQDTENNTTVKLLEGNATITSSAL